MAARRAQPPVGQDRARRGLEAGWRKVERAALAQFTELHEQGLEVDTAVFGRVRAEASDRFRELTLGRNRTPAPCLIPGDRHVNEALQEVALLGGRGAPFVLEFLVRGEVLARADQAEALLKA